MDINKLAVPIAIVIAGGLVAGAFYFSNIKAAEVAKKQQAPTAVRDTVTGDPRLVTSDDHILGNPNANIVVIEYSDPECPYCKMFHPIMHQLLTDYNAGGANKIAWVYRHFPIDSLHPKARKEAGATECANELGGPAKFWEYLDMVYDKTTSNNTLDPANLPKFAKAIGLDVDAFNKCLTSGKYASKIQADYDDAVKSGGRGTPHSIIVSKDGTKTPLEGYYPYDKLKTIIDAVLQ